jgi:peptide/nickel transport system permease protein
LAAMAMGVAVAIGFALGIAAASVPGAASQGAQVLIALGLSAPIYFTGTLAITLFATWLDVLPGSGAGRFDQLILPAAVLGFHSAAPIAQIVRASLTSTLQEPFIRAAEGRGLSTSHILIRHALRAGLTPVIGVIGLEAGFLLSGAVITETIFSRPGIGRVLIDAALRQDYPIVQGVVVWSALLYVGFSTVSELLAAVVDPRLRVAE